MATGTDQEESEEAPYKLNLDSEEGQDFLEALRAKSRFVAIAPIQGDRVKIRFLDGLKAGVPEGENWVAYLRENLPNMLRELNLPGWRLYEYPPILVAEDPDA